jgi:hypothetical protein
MDGRTQGAAVADLPSGSGADQWLTSWTQQLSKCFAVTRSQIESVAYLAEDYARMLFDAAERCDLMETAGRLQQLRFCTINMIQTFNYFLRTQPNGQGVAAGKAAHDHREDQRSGDGVA